MICFYFFSTIQKLVCSDSPTLKCSRESSPTANQSNRKSVSSATELELRVLGETEFQRQTQRKGIYILKQYNDDGVV